MSQYALNNKETKNLFKTNLISKLQLNQGIYKILFDDVTSTKTKTNRKALKELNKLEKEIGKLKQLIKKYS